MPAASSAPSAPSASTSILGLILRLYWLFVGNALLGLALLGAVTARKELFTFFSVLYWCVPVSLVITRFADIRFFKGETAENEPASMKHWVRYSVILAFVSLSVWVLSLVVKPWLV